MDVCGDSVLTCSKGTTIALSQFQGDTDVLEMKQRFEEHAGVVKCVRFAHCNPHIFASGGNDRELRVLDTRVTANCGVARSRSEPHSSRALPLEPRSEGSLPSSLPMVSPLAAMASGEAAFLQPPAPAGFPARAR
ncbi:hypothetical protein F441_23152 [Phytophthora nicotianae CJ01A1]|uniref:Uncharacterized protein n=1 Tax=Phytophthora nicotianae CJ01A1 TaxID=1317063 RepID=W2VMP1_PHYNI|nr:hypothetical protein F441_23152 [Phytophthora nicotianae CJ01A1]